MLHYITAESVEVKSLASCTPYIISCVVVRSSNNNNFNEMHRNQILPPRFVKIGVTASCVQVKHMFG